MQRLSRRDFIIKLTSAAAALGLAHRLGISPLDLRRANSAALPDVCVSRGTKTDSAEAILQTALDGLGGMGRFVKPGQTVAIKPNATWAYPPHTASSTDPDLLRAVVTAVQKAGARRIIVMDHCSIDPGAAESLRVSGIGALVDSLGVEQVFPDRRLASKDVYTQIDLPSGKEYKQLGVIKAAVEADVRINLAVAKSHNVTKLTLCMKHMMGFMEEPQLLHAWLYKGIADLNTPSPVQAQLHILEAIRVRVPFEDYLVCAGPETDESDPRVVKRMNQVVAGVDPCLVDAYACINYFAMQPRELAYLNVASQNKVGDINVVKAIADGRLLEYNVGELLPLATPTAVPTQTQPAVTATVEVNGMRPTADAVKATNTPAIPATQTPLPTATPNAAGLQPTPGKAVSSAACGEVVSAKSFLNVALIPAAAVVTGAGLVALKRLQKNEKGNPSDGAAGEHGEDNDPAH